MLLTYNDIINSSIKLIQIGQIDVQCYAINLFPYCHEPSIKELYKYHTNAMTCRKKPQSSQQCQNGQLVLDGLPFDKKSNKCFITV
jgi:hypothetical protein